MLLKTELCLFISFPTIIFLRIPQRGEGEFATGLGQGCIRKKSNKKLKRGSLKIFLINLQLAFGSPSCLQLII